MFSPTTKQQKYCFAVNDYLIQSMIHIEHVWSSTRIKFALANLLNYRILAVISAALINRSLAKIGGVRILECVFP